VVRAYFGYTLLLLYVLEYNYRWYLNNDPTNWISPTYSNTLASKSGSLYFESVSGSDAADYHCSVSIEDGGTESVNSAAYRLEIDEGSSKFIYRKFTSAMSN